MAQDIRQLSDSISQDVGVDPSLVWSVIQQESSGDPSATSEAGAGGLMQLMPATAKELDVQDVYDPEQNIRGGATYLKQLIDRFDGDVTAALSAYHSGPGRVSRLMEERGDNYTSGLGPVGQEYASGVMGRMGTKPEQQYGGIGFKLPPEDNRDPSFNLPQERENTTRSYRTRQAAYVGAMSEQPSEYFNRVMGEFELYEESPTVQHIRENAREASLQRDVERAQRRVLQSQGPDDATLQADLQGIANNSNLPAPSVREVAGETMATNEPTGSNSEEEAHWNSMERMAEIFSGPATSELSTAIRDYNPVGDAGGGLQQAWDIGRALVLPGFQLRLGAIISEAVPELEGKINYAMPGSLRLTVQDYVKSLNTEEELRATLSNIKKAILNNSELFGENNFEAWDFYDTLFGDIELGEEEFMKDVNTALLNVFGVMDLWAIGAPFARAGRRALRSFNRTKRSSPAETLAEIAPKTVREAHLRAEKDGTAADFEALGESRENMAYDHALPKLRGETLNSKYDLTFGFDIRQNEVLNSDFRSALFSPGERAGAQRDALAELEPVRAEFGGLNNTHWMSNTEVSEVSGGFDVSFTIGNSATRGFTTPEQALAVANRYREVKNGSQLDLLSRNYDTGEWERIDPTSVRKDEQGEYLLSIRDTHYYGREDLDGFDDDIFVGPTGSFAQYSDKSANFAKWWVNASNVASDRSSAILAELVEIRRPLTELPENKFGVVMSALERQEADSTWWTPSRALAEFDGDYQATEAFLAAGRSSQAMRQLLNRKFYRDLNGEGQKSVVLRTPSFNRPFLGRVEEEIPTADIKTAYDPIADRIVEIDDVEALYNQRNAQIITLRSPLRKGRTSTDYVIRYGDHSSVRVDPLPTEIIREIPGYMPRIYDANFVVARMREETHNGAPRTGRIPLAFARSRADADAELLAQKANAENPDEIRLITSREADDRLRAELGRSNIEYFADNGQLFTSERGELLAPLREGGQDGNIGLSPFLDSLDAAESRVANTMANGEMVDLAVSRWEKTWGEAFGINGKTMPLYGPLPRSKFVDINEADYAKAVAMRDHITLIARVDNSLFRQKYKEAMTSLSDSMYSSGYNRVGDWATDQARSGNPLDVMKKYSFVYNIVLAPLRQAMLQASQATMYVNAPGALRYMASSDGFFADMFNVSTRLLLPDGTRNRDEVISQMNRGDIEKADRIYRGLRRTGIVQSTDTHQYAIGFANDLQQSTGGTKTFFNKTGRLTDQGVRLIRRGGFDLGENTQLISAFLVERNRWIKENPRKADKWDTDLNLAEISGNARQRSLNMNASGSLGTQRGALSLPFQFMSHTMKALQVLIPETIAGKKVPLVGKLSNKFYTNKERTRIMMTQGILFGTGWLGYSNALESVVTSASSVTGEPIQIPQDVSMLVREGMFGAGMNMLARAAAGEELFSLDMDSVDDELVSNIIFSPSFAPFSGMRGLTPNPTGLASHPLTKIYETLIMGNYDNMLEVFFGPSYAAGQNVARALNTGLAAAGLMPGVNGEDLTQDARGIRTLGLELMRIIPFFDKWYQTKAVEEYNRLILRSGHLGVRASEGEAWFKRLIGTRTKREESVSEYIYGSRGLTRQVVAGDDTELNSVANAVFDRVLAYARQFENGEIDELEFQRLASLEHFAYRFVLKDDYEIEKVKRLIRDKAFSVLNENQESELAAILYRARRDDMRSLPEIITEIQNMPSFEGQESLIHELTTTAENFGYGGQ